MNVQKLNRILQHSLKELPELNSSEVKVEFSPNNEGLQVFSLGEPDITDFESACTPYPNGRRVQTGACCRRNGLGRRPARRNRRAVNKKRPGKNRAFSFR